ncbi:uncharacterized protein LOC120645502 [Panicum virgatum]|uniref:uncharacterized protein LOC120645502 n=1 Tax=Panicum virgatum TaxID=38727 RepID=UPI0019D673CD|nr:uncharacterized protein LOC120645502 [Panicum virgatum]
MKRKADEYRELQQGSMSVEEYTYQFIELARYAPEEVDKDEKKQDMFKKGLSPKLRTLLTSQIYPDFNTLMNMAILTERAKAEQRKENKRKFLESLSASRTASDVGGRTADEPAVESIRTRKRGAASAGSSDW